MYKRILVALKCDASDGRVLEEATTLAGACVGAVTLTHVVHSHARDESAFLEQKARECLSLEAAKLAAKGTAVDTLLMTGEPAEAILQAAADTKADLIIMATHGHSQVRHVLMGSVTEDVVRRGDISVLLVRP
jgi:nucleotide-binding universal stress UspA family protein